jgi:hypothetical protein
VLTGPLSTQQLYTATQYLKARPQQPSAAPASAPLSLAPPTSPTNVPVVSTPKVKWLDIISQAVITTDKQLSSEALALAHHEWGHALAALPHALTGHQVGKLNVMRNASGLWEGVSVMPLPTWPDTAEGARAHFVYLLGGISAQQRHYDELAPTSAASMAPRQAASSWSTRALLNAKQDLNDVLKLGHEGLTKAWFTLDELGGKPLPPLDSLQSVTALEALTQWPVVKQALACVDDVIGLLKPEQRQALASTLLKPDGLEGASIKTTLLQLLNPEQVVSMSKRLGQFIKLPV